MLTARRAVTPLRIFLVLLFILLLMLQTLSLPGQFAYLARQDPDHAYLRWPLTAVAVFLVLCVQAVALSTWKLLDLVRDDRIFSASALRWVDLIVRAVAAAWLTLLGLAALVVLNADDPGVAVLMTLWLVGVAVLGLLMVVMRALLLQATTLRTDLEGVI